MSNSISISNPYVSLQVKILLTFYISYLFSISARKRPKIRLSEEQQEYRALLEKDWARYLHVRNKELHQNCVSIQSSQEKALNELRIESEELYQSAIQLDEFLLPITMKGPVYTPPIKNYGSPAEYRLPLKFHSLMSFH